MHPLAIVIPAYKTAFLQKALDSLAGQTNKQFAVYIGDDCSDEPINSIVAEYRHLLTIYYTRFTENLGGKDLVAQWERCIELTAGEPWLWLFSDDDVADANCVEAFYNTITHFPGHDVYRFNTRVINSDGNLVSERPVGPKIEPATQMAYHILLDQRGNSMPDHIFSREVYTQNGGFINFPLAQGSDWASSISFATSNGMCIIDGAKLNWRLSESNVSGTAGKNKPAILKGHLAFLKWVHNYFMLQNGGGIDPKALNRAILINLRNVIKFHIKGVGPAGRLQVLRFLMRLKLPLRTTAFFVSSWKIRL